MKKYRKGEPIKTLWELLPIIFDWHEPVYFSSSFNERVFSAAFVANWSIGCITSYLRQGRLFRTKLNTQEVNHERS